MESSRSGLRGDPVGDNGQEDGTRDKSLQPTDLAPLTPTQGREEELARLRQDLHAHWALNSSLEARIEELEKDNEFQSEYLAKIEGVVNGTGSTGFIKWDLLERIRELKVAAQPDPSRVPAQVEVRALHQAVNVAIRREGGHVPSCDGPDCRICAHLQEKLASSLSGSSQSQPE